MLGGSLVFIAGVVRDDSSEGLDEAVRLLSREPTQDLLVGYPADRRERDHEVSALGGEVQVNHTAVRAVATALDETARLKPIDDTGHSRTVEQCFRSEPAERLSILLHELREDSPLGRGNPMSLKLAGRAARGKPPGIVQEPA